MLELITYILCILGAENAAFQLNREIFVFIVDLLPWLRISATF